MNPPWRFSLFADTGYEVLRGPGCRADLLQRMSVGVAGHRQVRAGCPLRSRAARVRVVSMKALSHAAATRWISASADAENRTILRLCSSRQAEREIWSRA